MPTTYYMDFNNNTEQTWTMGVYQTLPTSPGLESVSWKQTRVPRHGSSGVKWDITYNVMLGKYQQTGGIGVYKGEQKLSADLGTAWEIVYQDDVQQLQSMGDAAPGQIIIWNHSNRLAYPGFGMSGSGAVYKKDTLSGSSAQFIVKPTYWVALFNQIVLGEVISSNIVVGPLEIKFVEQLNRATLTASVVGSSIRLDLQYSEALSTSVYEIEQRLAAVQQFRPLIEGDQR